MLEFRSKSILFIDLNYYALQQCCAAVTFKGSVSQSPLHHTRPAPISLLRKYTYEQTIIIFLQISSTRSVFSFLLGGPPVNPPASMVCRSAAGETWSPHADGYCYLFNVDPRYTFDEAESACRTAGADLASIHSDADTSFITVHMEHMDVFGGNGGTKNVWIGLRKLDSGMILHRLDVIGV